MFLELFYKLTICLFVVMLQTGDAAFSSEDASAWFASNYHPQLEYSTSGLFVIDESNEFSPYKIIPRWDEAKCSVRGRGNKQVEEVVVPVLAERVVNAGYRLKGRGRNPALWDFVPCKQYLVVSRTRNRVSAVVRTVRAAFSDESVPFSGIIVDSDMNTGAMRTLYCYESGKLIAQKEFNGFSGYQLPVVAMLHVGGGGRTDSDLKPKEAFSSDHRKTEAAQIVERMNEHHKAADQARKDPEVIYQVSGVLNIAFPE